MCKVLQIKKKISTNQIFFDRLPMERCGELHDQFNVAPLIAGGQEIQRGTWPWLVAIFTKKNNGLTFICSGMVVAQRIVLTAAFCFRNSINSELTTPPSQILVILGKYDMSDWMENGSKIMAINAIHIHPDYLNANGSFDADIAVVVLSDYVEYNEFIQPICLQNEMYEVPGEMGIVAGWGSNAMGKSLTETPNIISLPIVSETDCRESNIKFDRILSNRTFCAGDQNGSGPCHGDSGAGLIVQRNNRLMLKGLVSAALAGPLRSCDLSNYVIFTDVTKFVPWIQSFY